MNDYKTELEKKGVIGFVPAGNSMWPTIKNGRQSVVVVKKDGRLKKYDVALYLRKNGQYVLHRVIGLKKDGYIMIGDSQTNLETVAEEQVVGVLQGFCRGNNFIECSDKKYIEEVEKWFKNEKRRQRKIKFFYFRLKIKNRIKRLFKKNKNEEIEND
ncbi:MAG: S24/S26 family peptidase [Clostridia bacterium]|nr:S24/S26 family peptidase [Clostridia bacterium]